MFLIMFKPRDTSRSTNEDRKIKLEKSIGFLRFAESVSVQNYKILIEIEYLRV